VSACCAHCHPGLQWIFSFAAGRPNVLFPINLSIECPRRARRLGIGTEPRMKLSRKLLFSYLAMALLTIVASTYAIYSFQNLNRLTYAIIHQDFLLLETSKQMMTVLLAQESAEKKYLIFQDDSLADIFWSRSREFMANLQQLRKHQLTGQAALLSRLGQNQERYRTLFAQEMSLVESQRSADAQALSATTGKQLLDAMVVGLRTVEKLAASSMDKRLAAIKKRGKKAARITVILSVVSLMAGFSLALMITYSASRPLQKLERATALIAEGKFDTELDIRRNDAIGRLAVAFERMAERLKVLEARNLDASPLTRLPGNRAIEAEIKRRLKQKQPFALCHVDLDNFKPFADTYGYAWGSEVIKEVGLMLSDVLTEHPDVFVGHIGGDDFVLICRPEQARLICPEIVARFDQEVPKFYSDKDLQRGFIQAKDRSGKLAKFPLLSITVAMVVDDGSRFANPLVMAEKAAELKEYAKSLPGSNFVCEEPA